MKRVFSFFFIYCALSLLNPSLWMGEKSLSLLPLSFLGLGCGGNMPAEESDTDLDGIPDLLDNCPDTHNPNQTDANGNGVGEVCEDFEARDGIIHCNFPACDFSQDCMGFLDQCVGTEAELAFTGQTVICCDASCLTVDGPFGECPAGTCLDNATHCEVDEDCEEVFEGSCFEGCCPSPLPPISDCFEIGLDSCDPQNPTCSEEMACLESSPGLFCCEYVFEDPCGNGICEPELGECDFCVGEGLDCAQEQCPCGFFPVCNPQDPNADQFCSEIFEEPGCCDPLGCCGFACEV